MTNPKWVIDASALLATIHDENGGDYLKPHIDQCVISSINWSEVLQKLDRAAVDVQQIDASLKALGLSVVEFTEEDARIAASLWSDSLKLGLSLADRACLATGIRLKSKVVTADKVWRELDLEVSIELIR